MSGIRNTMESSDVNNNSDVESIDSDSSGSDTELRAIDTRQHGGQLVLVRDNAVAPRPRPRTSWENRGRMSPGGTMYDNDGWPMQSPVVVATRVVTPVVRAQPLIGVFVPETPPRSIRAPVRTAPPRQVQQLLAAEERIQQLQDEVRTLKRNNRDMRSVRDTYITFGEELVIENDKLLEEIKELRKRPRVGEVIPAPAPALPEEVIDLTEETEDDDEFPLDNPEVYYPLPVELPEGETPGLPDNVNSL